MLLTPDRCDRAPLAEGDPLPPDDRVPFSPRPDLESLYRAHRPRVLRYFRRAVSAEAAADLCQLLFVRLSTCFKERTIANGEAYMQRSATNLAADHLRAELRRPRIDAFSAVPEPVGPDPVAALEARDLLRRIEAAIAGLKPRTREIFLAHRFDGLTYREIAARTGLSVKTVEKHMSRAIARIDRLSR